MVRAHDEGEPGIEDEFDIHSPGRLGIYTTEKRPTSPHELGDGNVGGGNIQLHKPNPSTTGDFGGTCAARSAAF